MDRKSFFRLLPGLLAAPKIAEELGKLPVQPIVHQGSKGIYAMMMEQRSSMKPYTLYVTEEWLKEWGKAIEDDCVMHQKRLTEASEN